MRFYGTRFLPAVPLGIVIAAVDQASLGLSRLATMALLVLMGPLLTVAYEYACWLVADSTASRRAWLIAFAAGTLVWIPAALLFPWFALAAVLWLALVGLCVPAAIVEGTGLRESLRRGLALGRVDYIHAAGSLATLVILFFLARIALALVLESQADETVRVAIFLADAALGPLLFLGGAILYFDQEARLRSRDRRKE
jgi:hypothetical protein